MADVEMTEPAPAAATATPKGKKVAAAAVDADGKKRFEVKKVCFALGRAGRIKALYVVDEEF
jgi:hypothetical protein